MAAVLNDTTDGAAQSFIEQAALVLESMNNDFWNESAGYISYVQTSSAPQRDKVSGLDIAVILGVLRGNNTGYGGCFGYSDEKVLATAYHLAMSMLEEYSIAGEHTDWNDLILGIPIG
jgi:hypothetical protein